MSAYGSARGDGRFGQKCTCGECGTRFYDLNRPAAICPRCGEDYNKSKPNIPVGGAAKKKEPEPEIIVVDGPPKGRDTGGPDLVVGGDDDTDDREESVPDHATS